MRRRGRQPTGAMYAAARRRGARSYPWRGWMRSAVLLCGSCFVTWIGPIGVTELPRVQPLDHAVAPASTTTVDSTRRA